MLGRLNRLLIGVTFLVTACAITESGQDGASRVGASPLPPEAIRTGQPNSRAGKASPDIRRLHALARERSKIEPGREYPIGPGDLIEVNVFDLEEMSRKARVSAAGYINLPLIGAVKASGQDETDLAREIARRLEKKYLQDPQVDVFVEEYKSQQVAVTGAVSKPGLYPLTRENYTMLDMLSEAGGLTKEAGGVIEFVPAQHGQRSAAFGLAAAERRLAQSDDRRPSSEGIVINLNELLRGANRDVLDLPVLAGDVIFVPEAGSFTIEGWVEKPGTYPLGRDSTVLAAIATGGGSIFVARLTAVVVLRSGRDSSGERQRFEVDVEAIREGAAADLQLRAGDVVRVPANPLLVPVWGAYALLRDLIRFGGNVAV